MFGISTARSRPFDPRTDLHRLIAFHIELVEINFPASGLLDGQDYDRALREEAYGSDGAFRKALLNADPRANGIFVWEEGSQLVGYLWLHVRHDDVLDVNVGTLREIFIVPDRRGSGLADKMMKFASEWFDMHQASIQRLNVTATNERAIKLYEKFGYKVTRYEMERINEG